VQPGSRSEETKRRVETFRWDVVGQDLAASAAPRAGGQHGLHVGRQRLRARVVAGHQAPRLHVEDEAGRRALGPAPDRQDVGDRVVGGVDLHHVEGARVEAQARLGGHGFLGIERA
jgi:hypothetical protein